MAPPSVPLEHCPYKLYHMGGGLANIIFGVIALLMFGFAVPRGVISFMILGEFGLVGIVTAATNLIPVKTAGVQNDGYNLIDIKKNPMALEYMNLVLEAHAKLSVVEDISELSKEFMNKLMSIDFTDVDVSNSTVANVMSFQMQFWIYEGNYNKAKELGNRLVDTSGVIELLKNEASCELLYMEILEGNSENIEKLYDKKLQNYIKVTSTYPGRQRLMFAYYYLYKKDEAKANVEYKKLLKTMNTHSINAEVVEELKL